MPTNRDRDRVRGWLLKQCRKEKGFSQKKLAEGIGVTEQTIYNWEKGKSWSQLDTMSRLCEILEIDAEKLSNIDRHCDCDMNSLEIVLNDESYLEVIRKFLGTSDNENSSIQNT